jgi:7,8-dihydropterin-6-yl-methyl-4-(beta-D-ribofuranosyl)aminobenzene 5'-phosphate synthase
MPVSLREVEQAEVICLVDNSVDVLLPTTDVTKRPKIHDWFERPLIAEHGFSSAITLEANGKKDTLLLDSGLDPTAAVHNADVLGFDLSWCNMVVSSHGHIDHAGGLLNIRKRTDPARKVPLIIHPHAFRNRVMKFPDGRLLPLPAPKRELLRDAGYEITETSSPTVLMDDRILVTGEVSRTNNFETGNPIHYAEVEGKMENDPLIKDDQAIVLKVKGKGLVVITGCGHSGIINTLSYAKELTGEDKIYAVMGGMHLSGGIFEPIIPRTVDELTMMKPTLLIPCHCTGLKATNEMMRSMPNAFIQNSVGTTYTF